MAIETLHFNIDLPAFLKEVFESNNQMGPFKIPIVVLQSKLIRLATIATKINNPELNILMLEMKLYDVKHKEIYKKIKEQQKLIK